MKRISFLVLLILVPFFTKAQEVVLSRDFGSGSVRLERKIDNQSFRQNRDGSRFYKTTFTIKVNFGGLNRSNEITDVYSDKGTAMEPCMLIDTKNKLLYMFILSKSNDKMYGMDGIVSRLDMNSGKWTRENVFNNINSGWFAYFRGSVNGNPELWHFSYAGYFNMCSTRNNNGEWSSVNKGSIRPEQAANQRSNLDNILVISSNSGTMIAEQKKSASQPIANNNSSSNTQNQNLANNNMSSGNIVAQNQYFDFSAACSTGQTLYYKQIDESSIEYYHIEGVKNPVKVTAPHAHGYEGFTKPTGNVTIPSKVTYGGITYTVAVVGANAFRFCGDLKSVIIPNTVKAIGMGAFYQCMSMNSITLPNSIVRIDSQAFEHAGLVSVKIPNSVVDLESGVFSCCFELESVVLPNKLKEISSSLFSSCTSLTSVTIPNTVTKIKSGAFYLCNISITIPSSVKKIDDYAFEGCMNVIYHGNLKGAPWGARCFNGYVKGDCVYKDKTMKTLVYCKPSEDAKVAESTVNNKSSSSGGSVTRKPIVNENNIMDYVKSMESEKYYDDQYYYVYFKEGIPWIGTIKLSEFGDWEWDTGHHVDGLFDYFRKASPNTKLGALVNLYNELRREYGSLY